MSRASRDAADRRIASLEKENERLRAVLIEHVVLAEYDNSPQFPLIGYVCQICNDKGDESYDLIHMGDCPLYEAEKDAPEAGS